MRIDFSAFSLYSTLSSVIRDILHLIDVLVLVRIMIDNSGRPGRGLLKTFVYID